MTTSELFAMLLVLASSGLAAFFLSPWAGQLGLRWEMVAIPGGRRQHAGRIPQTGGVAIFLAFLLAVLVAQAMPIERQDPKEVIRLTGLILGGLVVFILGLLDDRYELAPVWIGAGQIVAAGIAVAFLIFIETVNNPFTGRTTEPFPFWFTVMLSLFWMGLLMNTVNFLDGADGLATGVCAIAALTIFIHAAFRLEQMSVGLLALALFGATLGFLPHNFQPAKIYLGSGAYLLGYLLALLSIIGGAKVATVLLVLGLPLMDLAWQAGSRMLRGQNPMKGDRGHLHFRLIDAGLPARTIAFGYYAFCAFFGLIALTTASQLFKLIALGVMGLLVSLVFIAVSIASKRTPPHG